MFRSISWGQYFTFLLIGLAFFYGWLHRRFRILDALVLRIKQLIGKAPDQPAHPINPEPQAQPQAEPQPKAVPSTESESQSEPPNSQKPPIQTTLFLTGLLATATANAQNADGNAGINQANTLIRSYFTTATQLMYAISAVIGLAGAIHVYVKMLRGHHDTQQAATAWFSACIFIAVVATVIQFFFGL
jgi:hypothetical protein